MPSHWWSLCFRQICTTSVCCSAGRLISWVPVINGSCSVWVGPFISTSSSRLRPSSSTRREKAIVNIPVVIRQRTSRRAKSTNTSHRAFGWWVLQFTSPQGCCRGWPVRTACSPCTRDCWGASNKKPGYFRAVEAAAEKNTHLIKVSSHHSQDGSRQRFHSATFRRPGFVPCACNRPWAAVGGEGTAGLCWTHEGDRPPRHPGEAMRFDTAPCIWIPWSESWWPGLWSSIN